MVAASSVIERFESETFAADAASLIATAIRSSVKERGRCTIGLCGGSTPGAVYSALGRDSSVPWASVTCFLGDERWVNELDPQSNSLLVRQTLQARGSPGERCRFVAPDTTLDPATGAVRYADLLLRELGKDLTFDIMLLGIGEDGHTASIFPGSELVTESPEFYTTARHPQNFSMRITLTRTVLERSRQTFFLAKGAAKKAMIARVLDHNTPELEVPAALWRSFHGRTTFLLDYAASP